MRIPLIWQRYLFGEMLKVFFLFLGCFFFLYALIDYSLHIQEFISDHKIHLAHLLSYYSAQFIKRSELLIPLALLIATLKVLFSLNTRGELIALQSSGVPRKKILRPLFLLGLLGLGFNLISAEYLLPPCLNELDQFRMEHFRHAHLENRNHQVRALALKDQSKLIYKEEDPQAQIYKDVFWVRSANDIWHMSTLSTNPDAPQASYVDHLERSKEGLLEKKESFDSLLFPKFRLEADPTGRGSIPLENRKISELIQLCYKKEVLTRYEHPQALTHLLFKLIIPLLSPLVIAAVAPFCLKHRRHLPLLLTYTCALFAFITFFVLMDGAVILGENLTLSPYLALLTPMGLLSLAVGIYYYKSV